MIINMLKLRITNKFWIILKPTMGLWNFYTRTKFHSGVIHSLELWHLLWEFGSWSLLSKTNLMSIRHCFYDMILKYNTQPVENTLGDERDKFLISFSSLLGSNKWPPMISGPRHDGMSKSGNSVKVKRNNKNRNKKLLKQLCRFWFQWRH